MGSGGLVGSADWVGEVGVGMVEAGSAGTAGGACSSSFSFLWWRSESAMLLALPA